MKQFLPVILCLIVLVSCTQPRVTQSRNEKLYKKENNELNARFCVYHLNDSISMVYYDIYNEALIYKKTDTSNYFYSGCRLFFKSAFEPDFKPLYDSITVHIYDRQLNVGTKHLTGNFAIKAHHGNMYFGEITVTDVNKHAQYVYPQFIDKSSHVTRQNFLIRNANGSIHFDSYFSAGESISLETQTNPDMVFTVDYFYKDFKIAKPPFSAEPMEHFSYKPDSSFTISKSNDLLHLTLPDKGFYHIRTDAETKDGVTCFVYEPSYPKISNTYQMILATRYIMSKKEFDAAINAPDQKTAIDKFWLDIAGSNERAHELIRKYYGRVQESNKLFTSHREGWKTDRGMVYIVFGAPNMVIKRKNGEAWVYGESGNPNSLVFSFLKVLNPFTDNDYTLERSEIFKTPWYQAVDFWRQGRIYLDN
ncbi:MAG: GWxTD domain-containing protein [Bacteroidetes bacterium]|nr:GWxTD domain-containing protein [Bacteroidota bacterium]